MNTTLMTILSLLVISGFFLFYSRNGMSGELGPDRQVIQQLNKAGSNIGKPHHIEFFIFLHWQLQSELQIRSQKKASLQERSVPQPGKIMLY